MIKTIALVSMMVGITAHSQKVVNTYYDYAKTVLYESYQVNSSGKKNGWYKGYDQNGLVKVEASYKNGELDGTRTEYATGGGKRILAKTETYKDNLLNGPAKYYSGSLVIQQGEYVNGEKHGEWLDAYHYTNYDLNDEEKKGCEFIKRTIQYENGNVVEPNIQSAEITETFYPSGKIRAKIPYVDGKKHGTAQYYFPSGIVEMEEGYDQGKLTYTMLNYPNGNLREYDGLKNGVETYEGYNKDGTPSLKMKKYEDRKVYQKKEEERERQNKIRLKKEEHADSILLLSGLEVAQPLYDELGINTLWLQAFQKQRAKFLNWEISTDEYKKKSSILQVESEPFESEGYDKRPAFQTYIDYTIASDVKEYNEVNAQWNQITEAKKKFDDLYGPPSYLRSSTVYKKASLVIDEMMKAYKAEKNFASKKALGETLLAAYTKMNSYTKEQCKEFKKTLKKIDDVAQIRSILGL